jgi:hypothetical protein
MPEHGNHQPKERSAQVTLMNSDRMFELAQALAAAKGRQDVAAAMKLFDTDMLLEAPSFGTKAQGLAENEATLAKFFRSFPDYSVALEGHANNGETLICWGTVGMTMTGDRFGVVPNGAFSCRSSFNSNSKMIAREPFFFDLSALCAQSGVSTDAVRRKLFGETTPSAVVAK